jgi:hypothetical protein
VRDAIPDLPSRTEYNHCIVIPECYIASADVLARHTCARHYNSKYFPSRGNQKEYDEFRVTSWGGRTSPMQDPENTGSILIYGLKLRGSGYDAVAWITSSESEEDIVEDWAGASIEPGHPVTAVAVGLFESLPTSLEIPDAWLESWPTCREIFDYVRSKTLMRPSFSPDRRLIVLRDAEYAFFAQLEGSHVLNQIRDGFPTVDEFLRLALSVSNRRKTRGGASLELNVESLLREEQVHFQMHTITENRKRPDFLFPSAKAYHCSGFSSARLRMLACKSTCKDRWRQIINEADRIAQKHLLTLQEGASPAQLEEMAKEGVTLVVPQTHLQKFPADWRSRVLTVGQFFSELASNEAQIGDMNRWIT